MDIITLRALTESDIPQTLDWHNRKDIRDLYIGHPFPVNREMEELWYSKILTSNYPTTVFGIELNKPKKLIGLTFLKNINSIHRNAEFAIYIGDKENRGKGYSLLATTQTLEFAFNNLGLNRVFLKVLQRNTIAVNLYKKAGFETEGKLRCSIFKNDCFEDELIMGLLKSDFKKQSI